MIEKNKLELSTAIIILIFITGGCWQGPTSQNRTSASMDSSPTPAYNSSIDNKNDNTDTNNNSDMTDSSIAEGFKANLPSGFEMPTDNVGKKLLEEYGSVFIARGGARPPLKVVYRDENDVRTFQSTLSTSSITLSGHDLELQTAALNGLKAAIAEAQQKGKKISPRGKDSAKRTYDETVSLWKSRVDPALRHWVGNGRLTQAEADRLKGLSTFEQVTAVLELEEKGLYFAKDLSKSIIYSVAPPGTSQHLSMLALDVAEFDDAEIRRILANHGWFQTVSSDLPHFTYLGVKESELPGLGLKKVENSGRVFWVPNIL